MLYACVQTFDVMRKLENFLELNMALGSSSSWKLGVLLIKGVFSSRNFLALATVALSFVFVN
jgi:hypothetical protein